MRTVANYPRDLTSQVLRIISACEGKLIPVQACYRPRRLLKFEAPRFRDKRHKKVARLSALLTGRLYPRRIYPWYSFLSEAESIPETKDSRKDYTNEKIQCQHRESNPRPSGLYRSASMPSQEYLA